MLLDSKLVKLSDEVVLLYLAGVWTSHGKEVLVVVVLLLLRMVVMLLVMVMSGHLCYPVRE